MMLDIDFRQLSRGALQYLPIGALVGLILLIELLLVVGAWVVSPEVAAEPAAPIPPLDVMTNTEALGQLLYTRYVFFFQMSGVILLVAMVGAIVLTLRHKEGVKRQDIGAQVGRTREASIEVRKVESGKGI
jgi:NADH-quinone oxidoreductase subunit J